MSGPFEVSIRLWDSLLGVCYGHDDGHWTSGWYRWEDLFGRDVHYSGWGYRWWRISVFCGRYDNTQGGQK